LIGSGALFYSPDMLRSAVLAAATVAIALASAVAMTAAMAQPAPAWQPTRAFVQVGTAAHRTDQLVLGAIWDWPWQRTVRSGVVTGYWEASLGRWSAEHDDGRQHSAWVTQAGITPVIRLERSNGWFVEGGIGAYVLTPVYQSGDKRFSTTFNFGDHIGAGLRFGADRQHEVALRLQHFSNAGIRHPNPGENFVQIRYAVRF